MNEKSEKKLIDEVFEEGKSNGIAPIPHPSLARSQVSKYPPSEVIRRQKVLKNAVGKKPKKDAMTISVKEEIDEQLKDKALAGEIANAIIQGAVMGEDKKIEFILKLQNALTDKPSVLVQNNNVSVTPEVIQMARDLLKKDKIIDVDSSKA